MIAQITADFRGETAKYPFAVIKIFNRLPAKAQQIWVIAFIVAKATKEVLKICLVAFLLWTCGYITLKQLLLFYLILFGGILLNAIAPAISSIPSEWVGLKPAMILFNKFAHENLEVINSLEEDELAKAIRTRSQAAKIISNYLSTSPDLLQKYPEISEVFREVNFGISYAQQVYDVKKQQRLRKNEQKKRAEETYWQYVQQERRKLRLRNGVPPLDSESCPVQFPIRATTNLSKTDSARGIYYYIDEIKGVEVYWCFASPKEAEADNFRRPKKTPPKQQPK